MVLCKASYDKMRSLVPSSTQKANGGDSFNGMVDYRVDGTMQAAAPVPNPSTPFPCAHPSPPAPGHRGTGAPGHRS